MGYNEENWINPFWDLMQMFKKLTSIFLMNYFSNTVQNIGLFLLLVILMYVTLLKWLMPYKISNSFDY
jgi:hypothetical protein